jgi:hypothetical protein
MTRSNNRASSGDAHRDKFGPFNHRYKNATRILDDPTQPLFPEDWEKSAYWKGLDRINRGHPNKTHSCQSLVRFEELLNLTLIFAYQLELNSSQRGRLVASIVSRNWRGYDLHIVILAMAMHIVHMDLESNKSIRKTHPNCKPLDPEFKRMVRDLTCRYQFGSDEEKYQKALSVVRSVHGELSQT